MNLAFDGGRLSSDGGVLLLREIERRLGLAERLASCLRDWRDPAFKLAVGRLPESDPPLCSQPTMSRLEKAPSKIEIARLMAAMVDLFCASWARPPASIVLDIDDT
ncbi:MAG: IS1380 family transposase, partial [Alphaproteobacteria bacterium]|nr:IS1380 family transposase [Alphaproteobacteria bacterium]